MIKLSFKNKNVAIILGLGTLEDLLLLFGNPHSIPLSNSNEHKEDIIIYTKY